ncbi:MAG TPA: alpha/beta hydrolase, partial [Dehalococcoidia bacterium]
LSVPLTGRGPVPPTQAFKQAFGDRFFYMLYFQEPGRAEAELEADVRRTMRLILYAWSGDAPPGAAAVEKPKTARLLDGLPEPERLPAWLTEADLEYYVREFQRTGFRGGLNRYRNLDRDWAEIPEMGEAVVRQPALFMAGERDGVLAFARMEGMQRRVPNLRTVILPGCGHWTQQERPAEVNAALIEFLNGLP